MTAEVQELKQRADYARLLYRGGQITREQANKEIQPYAEAFNVKSKEIARKYNRKPQIFSSTSYLR